MNTEIPLFPPYLTNVPNYVWGGKPASVRNAARLHLNEVECSMPPELIEHLLPHLQRLNLYPPMIAWELTEELANAESIPRECVLVGPGSAALLHSISQALIAPGDRVVYPWPSFESYPVVATFGGAAPHPIPLRPNAEMNLEAIVSASAGAKVVILCEPNNPTGLDVGASSLLQALKAIDSGAVVVVDQAYVEFQAEERRTTIHDLFAAHPRMVVLRTFSKAYGLAGLRIGMAYVSPELALPLHKTLMPCGVTSLASTAASWSLRHKQVMWDRVATIVATRDRLRHELASIGVTTLHSQTNFVLARMASPELITQQLREQGVLVRSVADLGLRITVGSDLSAERFVSSMAGYAASAAGNPATLLLESAETSAREHDREGPSNPI